MMTEEVKRLEPTKKVLRELFLKSGNECAFPACTHKLISSSGVFIAEICHIEAALEGGERFNSNQINEQRRSFENLILLCHAHHKITDDVHEYTVKRMKEIKLQHESKFTDIVSTIQHSFQDHTEYSKIKPSSSLARFNRVLKWNESEKELVYISKNIISPFAEKLRSIPTQARSIFSLMVKRAISDHNDDFHISIHEIKFVTGATETDLYEIIQILDKYSLTKEGEPDEKYFPTIDICPIDGWHFVRDLQEFCKIENIALEEILVDLNFSLLD